MGQGLVWKVPVAFLLSSLSIGIVAGGSYRFSRQVFELKSSNDCTEYQVANYASILFGENPPDIIEITIPYGEDEIPEHGITLFSSGSARIFNVVQDAGMTTVSIELADKYREGDTLGIYLDYKIEDLPGKDGIARSKRSLLDLLLGMKPRDFVVTYKPAVFHAEVDELFLNMYSRKHKPRNPENLTGGHTPNVRALDGSYTLMVPAVFGTCWWYDGEIPTEPRFRLTLKGRPPLYGVQKALRNLGRNEILLWTLLSGYTTIALGAFLCTFGSPRRKVMRNRSLFKPWTFLIV